MPSAETVHPRRRSCTLTRDEKYGIIIMLLAVTEDRATLRSDPSAVYGVSGKSDAMDVVALLFCILYTITTLPGNPNALNSGFGQSSMSRRLLTHQISDTPFRLRMDSLQSITRG